MTPTDGDVRSAVAALSTFYPEAKRIFDEKSRSNRSSG